MYKTLSAVYYHPNMEAKIQKLARACQVCKKSKTQTKKYGHVPILHIDYNPWEAIQIDLFGPWTYTDITGIERKIQGISIINIATRWVELQPYNTKRSEDITLILDREWFA